MDGLHAELADLLRQEIAHYRRLLLLIRRERDRIVKGEVARLAALVREKEGIIRGLARLEACRAALMEPLAAALGEPGANLTLARVAQAAPGEAGEILRNLLADFRAVIGRLVAANEINQQLLDRSLEFVRGSLNLFRTLALESPTYGSEGRPEVSGTAVAVLNHMA